MITLYENTNWIAQHHNLLGLLCLVVAVLSAAAFITLFYTSLSKQKSIKYHNIVVCSSLVVFIISGCLIVAIMMQGPRYSGSANYTVEQVKTQSSGKQMIVVNDGKSDVEMDVKDNDKTSYTKGDKVKIVVRSNKSDNAGKHYLSNIKRSDSSSPDVFSAHYTIEKLD